MQNGNGNGNEMALRGELLIGGGGAAAPDRSSRLDAASGEPIAAPRFGSALAADVDEACRLAAQADDGFRALAAEPRARLLEDIATRIEGLGDALIERAMVKAACRAPAWQRAHALPASCACSRRWCAAATRATCASSRRCRSGSHRAARCVSGAWASARWRCSAPAISRWPSRWRAATPPPRWRPAARWWSRPTGASRHLRAGRARGAGGGAAAGLPPGVFSLLFDAGHEAGAALVAHPAIQAVGFTGSRAGGLALMRIAAARAVPIPVYAEMSSVNPNLLLPAALAARGEALAAELVASVTLGCGQFCTNPGLMLAWPAPPSSASPTRRRRRCPRCLPA